GIAVPLRRMAQLDIIEREQRIAPGQDALRSRDVRTRIDARHVDVGRIRAPDVGSGHGRLVALREPIMRRERSLSESIGELGCGHASESTYVPADGLHGGRAFPRAAFREAA